MANDKFLYILLIFFEVWNVYWFLKIKNNLINFIILTYNFELIISYFELKNIWKKDLLHFQPVSLSD